MTEQDRQHAITIINWFSTEAFNKYHRGTVEHGGHLPDKGGLLAEAEAEALDLPIYLRTLRDQLDRVLTALRDGRVDEAITSLHRILNGTPADRLTV